MHIHMNNMSDTLDFSYMYCVEQTDFVKIRNWKHYISSAPEWTIAISFHAFILLFLKAAAFMMLWCKDCQCWGMLTLFVVGVYRDREHQHGHLLQALLPHWPGAPTSHSRGTHSHGISCSNTASLRYYHMTSMLTDEWVLENTWFGHFAIMIQVLLNMYFI